MSERLTLPVLPLREIVLFPGVSTPIGAGRPTTLRAIEAALKGDSRLIFGVSQRENVDHVTPAVLYTTGTIAKISQIQRGLGGVQLLLHGEKRGAAVHYVENQGHLEAVVREVEDLPPLRPDDPAFVGLHREARERAAELGQKSGLPEEVVRQVLEGVSDPGRLADLVAGYLEIDPAERQALLETLEVEERLRRVLVHVQRQIGVLDAQEHIKSQVQEELGERQRELFLREQMKAIRKELGEGDETSDVEELRKRLAALQLPDAAQKEVERELARLERAARDSMEAQVIRTYLETVAELPWNKRAEESLDLKRAAAILDEDHYGLQDVKDEVLEFLSVRQLRQRTPEGDARGNDDDKQSKGSILLFVGPPGVGKTSIAKSIARAMGRPYVRISLGGARDEADIRGHRRTYVGAMPGRIIQGMKQAGAKNPVFLLDEVDKLGVSFQGDPAAALLEVLDPAERFVYRSLPRGAVRPVGGAVRRDRELPAVHPRAAARPARDRQLRRVHRAREARDREALPAAASAAGNGARSGAAHGVRCGAERDHHELHARSGRAPAGARDRQAGPQGSAQSGGGRGGARRRRGVGGRRLDRAAQGASGAHGARGRLGRRDRHVLHAGRRRHHVCRGERDARQG